MSFGLRFRWENSILFILLFSCKKVHLNMIKYINYDIQTYIALSNKKKNQVTIDGDIFCFILALLSGTLRTYQRAGCDNDIVTLKCPAGTSISVQIAQYGKSVSSKGLCSKLTSTTTSLNADISESTVCLLPNTIQVSVLYYIPIDSFNTQLLTHTNMI